MKDKIVNWLRTHEPISSRYALIFMLVMYILRDKFLWGMTLMMGFVTYPTEIDYVSLFEKAGETIGKAYANALTKIYEVGLNLGEIVYPHNSWIAKILSYGSTIFLIAVIIIIIMNLINLFMYRGDKQK